jgi:mRNA interferase HigB
MRIVARSTLTQFVLNRVPAAQKRNVLEHLEAWYRVATKAAWRNSAELKKQFGSASIVSAKRVVFNIKGNHYRLVVSINYEHQAIFIKWLGTHAEYDRIKVLTVAHQKERYADLSDSK